MPWCRSPCEAGSRPLEPAFVAGQEAGSRFQLTIWVEDADAVCADLLARGVVLLRSESRPVLRRALAMALGIALVIPVIVREDDEISG